MTPKERETAVHPIDPAKHVVVAEVARYRVFRERLLADIPDLDETTLNDTLEGITNLRELLAEVTRSALNDEAIAAGLSTRLADMRARIDRFEHRARIKRQLVLRTMVESDIGKLAEADFTASLRQAATALDVLSEDKIPPVYWKPQPPKLDKQGLLAALKSGTQIEGVAVAPPQMQLTVRTK